MAAVVKVEVKVARVPVLDEYEDATHLGNMQMHTPHPPDQLRGLRGACKAQRPLCAA